MDDQVAVPTDEELRKLLSKFVCVRMIQMWGVDLKRFQFDYALTWAVFFMNADGTIYGRYGTRSAMRKQSARDISVAGFVSSMKATLELHERFGKDADAARREVQGKQTQHPPKWSTPERIPTLSRNKRLAVPFKAVAQTRNARAHGVGCIHCHMVPDNELLSLRETGNVIADRLIWPYPMPYVVGLHMNPRHRSTVQRVVPESIAVNAGLRAGDEILRLDSQTILSTADIQWALHNAGDGGLLPIVIRRDGETIKTLLQLPKGWRRRLGDWRFTNLGVCMRIAGFNGRPTRGGGERLAIRINRVHRKRPAGTVLLRNDIIVALDGKRDPMNLGNLTRFLLDKKPGSELEVTVRRRGEEKKVRFKLD